MNTCRHEPDSKKSSAEPQWQQCVDGVEKLELKGAAARDSLFMLICRRRDDDGILFAHLKRILRLGCLRLRGPYGAKDQFLLATAQNLRRLARLRPAGLEAAA
jgi:hypothetical protein